MSKMFFRNHHWGAPLRILWKDLGSYCTVRNKNSHNEINDKGNGEFDHTPGLSPLVGQWLPPPISCLAPGGCIHPRLHLKYVPSLVVFALLVVKSWRRACHTTIAFYGVPHWPRVIWKKDSGVLFHTLYVTITNSQLQKKRMLSVIHFNPSRSSFYRDIFC